MALCTVSFLGDSISKACQMNVLLPEGDGPFGVLYLLHGLHDDYTIWLRLSDIERHVAGMPLIVVMPDGGRSFYCNDPRPNGSAYEDHVVKDVVSLIDRTFPTIASRGGRAVAGISMGGYGAVMLAMRHPEVFSVAAAHSGVFSFAHEETPNHPNINVVAEPLPAGKYDCYNLAEKLKAGSQKLSLRMDCGTEDWLLEANRKFHGHLEKLGIAHTYEEHPGGHDWDYFDAHVPDTLKFVVRNLEAASRPV